MAKVFLFLSVSVFRALSHLSHSHSIAVNQKIMCISVAQDFLRNISPTIHCNCVFVCVKNFVCRAHNRNVLCRWCRAHKSVTRFSVWFVCLFVFFSFNFASVVFCFGCMSARVLVLCVIG